MNHLTDDAYLALQLHAFRELYFSAFNRAFNRRNQELKLSDERTAAVMADEHASAEEHDKWRREIVRTLETAKEFAEIVSKEMRELTGDVEAMREMVRREGWERRG